jgi:hypothetical protein
MGYKVIKFYEHIMNDHRLKSLQEKIILNHIWGFQVEDKCTFSSDSTIANLIATSEFETRQIIQSLVKRGIVLLRYPKNSSTRYLVIATPGELIECAKDNQDFDIFDYTEL